MPETVNKPLYVMAALCLFRSGNRSANTHAVSG